MRTLPEDGVERVLQFYQVAFRKKIYTSIDDVWLKEYNEQRPHSGKYCFGKIPMGTFLEALHIEKMIGYHPTDSVA